MSHPVSSDAPSGAASRVGAVILGFIFVACTGALGALLGGTYVRFLTPRAADGWTGIAQGLGGLMVGGVIALIAAAFLVVPLARRGIPALAWSTAAVAALAGLLLLVLYLARPQQPTQGAALERVGVGIERTPMYWDLARR